MRHVNVGMFGVTLLLPLHGSTHVIVREISRDLQAGVRVSVQISMAPGCRCPRRLCRMSADSFVVVVDIAPASEGSSVAVVAIIAPDIEDDGSSFSCQPCPSLTLNGAIP